MEEMIIAVMGATGVGKSTLIRTVTGDSSIRIGHELSSETQNITAYPVTLVGYRVVLVDTPGFDDTYRSDRDILQTLVSWLTTTYRAGTRLSGILYLHRITDIRMQGSALRNLRVFRSLCGEDCLKHVALITTFWDTTKEDESVFESRVSELTQNDGFWGGMVASGSEVYKGPLTRALCMNAIYKFITIGTTSLKIQQEMVDEKKAFDQTSVGLTFLDLELKRQKQDYEAQMLQARKQFEDELANRQKKFSEDLETMNLSLQRKLTNLEESNQKLRDEIDTGSSSKKRNRTLDEEKDRSRKRRLAVFNEYLKTTIQLLENGKRYGSVKCEFHPRKACYLMICSNCFRNIGSGTFYKCIPCSIQQPFILCSECFEDENIWCDDPTHDKLDMSKGRSATMNTCPRVSSPPQDSPLLCKKCFQNVDRCYLHCCGCSEAWELCVKCAMKGQTCPGGRRPFPLSSHKLEICCRYLEV